MTEHEKKTRILDRIKGGLSYISQIIYANILPKIAESAEGVMNNIDNRIIQIEKRILRKISSLLIIGLGGLFLIFGIFFLLRESLGWSNATAYFSIGITVFVIGLLLKLGEAEK